MPRPKQFRPLRNFKPFPTLNPIPFDPRSNPFIPEQSITANKIREVSPLSVQNIGIKVYGASAQSTADDVAEPGEYDTVVFNQGFEEPSGTITSIAVPYDGVYGIGVSTEWADNNTGRRVVFVTINGTNSEGDVRTAQNTTRSTIYVTRRLTAGDTVGTSYRQTSTIALDINGGEDDRSLSVFFLGAI